MWQGYVICSTALAVQQLHTLGGVTSTGSAAGPTAKRARCCSMEVGYQIHAAALNATTAQFACMGEVREWAPAQHDVCPEQSLPNPVC
jgi:hypothetical protein